MATNRLRRVIQSLGRAAGPEYGSGPADGQLLERYVRGREEAAFAALVHRHGPMVWGVCRRILRSPHDAEDAFQATFLVLVRKAASVVPRDKVANWLYGVARQTALYARATAARRGAREKQGMAMPEPVVEPQGLWDDVQPLLDQELGRLPEKYREVLVLCDLQGKTRKEAARHFRVPEGTVASRLATARAMLAKRLARHGLPVTGGVLAAILAQNGASAAMPASVASNTIQAAGLFAAGQAAAGGALSGKAVALAEGVLRTMLATRLKTFGILVIAALALGTSAAVLGQQLLAERQAGAAAQVKDQPAGPQAKDAKLGEQAAVTVSGLLKAVDAAKGSLTIAHRDGDKTFPVPADAMIQNNGRPGDLVGLPVRSLITLSLAADRKTVRSVEAVGPNVGGTLKAIDAAKNAVTLDDRGIERTFALTRNATVQIDGKPGRLAAVPPGAVINLSWFTDPKTARTLEATGRWWQEVRVKAVDAQKHTISFPDDERVVEVAGKTLPVKPDAVVQIDGKPGKLAAIPPGAHVTLTLCADQHTVHGLSAEGAPYYDVLVKAVDAGRGTITFADEQLPGSAPLAGKTFPVARHANLVIDGRPGGKLASISAGTVLNLGLSVDQKSILSLNAQGPGFQNVPVKAVDAARRTVTFGEHSGDKDGLVSGKTLAVAKDAAVVIDGRPGKLDGVPAGATVQTTLSVDRKTVCVLTAQGAGYQNVPVKAVDAAKHTVTFATENAPAELAGKTFPVVQNAAIEIDYKPGTLAGVPPGASVHVSLTVDQKAVAFLTAAGAQIGGPGGVIVVGVDVGKNAITVDIAEEGEKTFPLAKDAVVEVDRRRGTLAMVPKDAFVILTLAVDRKTVRGIEARGLSTDGVVVKAVDGARNTITFGADGPPAQVAGKTFPVASDATINIDGKRGPLAAVPPGAIVGLLLSVDQKTVLAIQAEGALIGATGGVVVQAVDPEKNTITIDVNGEGEKTYLVAKDTAIRIDGKPGKLAQVPKEAAISLRLCADQKTVARLEAKSP